MSYIKLTLAMNLQDYEGPLYVRVDQIANFAKCTEEGVGKGGTEIQNEHGRGPQVKETPEEILQMIMQANQ